MAETILKLVLEKVTDPVVNEVLHLCGVEKQVEKVQRELDWIRAFLKDADMKQIHEERQKQWVREVREVAYTIEDVIDTFLCEVPERKPGKTEAIKRWFEKTKKLPVIHKLGEEINEILARLKEISENKEKYGIHSLGEGTGGVKKLPIKPPVLPDIEDEDVVGLDQDKDNIIKQLLDDTNPRRCVVSIVGPGGLGKTTLAKKVYNSEEVKRTYDIRIWIAISQEFKLIDASKKILQNLRNVDKSEEEKGEEYFLTELNKSLKDRKYLLIFDDVWDTDFWIAIRKAMPDDENGSKILMTTRKYEVAKDSDPRHEPYKLNFLTEESSQELFLKKAFPNEEILTRCPTNLYDLMKKFVKRCGGLPLALVVLGGLLAKKEPTYYVWNKVMQTMNWHTNEQKACTEIIATSFDDLPLALKSCFMYFAAFPEDHEIDVQTLLKMWIAEGFIPQEENRTLEDTARSFIEELTQRSMVQVSARSLVDDSILTCRIHDLMRDIAIQKAKEDNFMSVCLNQDEVQRCRGARRVAIHDSNDNELMKYETSNLRTLLCFKSKLPDCSGHKLLKVLHQDIWGNISKGEKKNLLGQLSQLRYLCLDIGTSVVWNKKHFEQLIGNMKFLQSIGLRGLDDLDHIPDCIWHVKTLRHVNLPYEFYALGPPPSSDLRNLQTLYFIKTRESWKPTTLPNMPNLRSLWIEITEGFPLETFVAFLRTLENLEYLSIKGTEIPIEVVDMKGFPFYQHLMWLRYEGRLSCQGRNMETTMFPTHITGLSLIGCELQQDPFVVLEKLQGLKQLSLDDAYRNQTMRCSAGGFPCLQQLDVCDIKELEEWEIEEGAMPMLKELHIGGCPMLQVPHGLQHLTALRHLICWGLGESGAAKAKKIRNICQHVPSIDLYYENDDPV